MTLNSSLNGYPLPRTFIRNDQPRKTILPSVRDLFPELFDSQRSDTPQEFLSNRKKEESDDTIYYSPSQPTLTLEDYNKSLYKQLLNACKPFVPQVSFYNSRLRRKSYQVERFYKCTHPGCTKSYGELSHLNTHIFSKNHGRKRVPQEFIALRQALRTRALENRF